MKQLLLVLILNLLFLATFAQNKTKIDSLKQVIATTKQDTIRIKTYLNLGKLYQNTFPDTALLYYSKALKIAQDQKEQKFEAKCFKSIGLFYYYQSNYDSTLFYWKKTLKIVENLGDQEAIAGNLGNIGIIYMNQSNYPEALEYFQEALKIDEEFGNYEGIARNLGNIGIIYSFLNNYPKALEYYQKSLKFNEKTGDKSAIAKNLVNIGNVYDELNNYSKALEYYQKALKINKELGNKYSIAVNLGNIGNIYNALNNYSTSLEYYKKALKIDEELNNKQAIAIDLGNIGYLYYKQKQYSNAILFANKSLEISKEIGALNNEKEVYLYLSEVYKKLGNYKKALKYKEMYIMVKDSIFNDEKRKSFAKLEAKYEYEKKAAIDSIANAKQIELKNAQIAQINAEKEAQRKQKNFLLLGLFIIFFFTGFLILLYIQKQKANKLLTEQKQQIAKANKELKQLNKNLKLQNEEITYQRNEIKKQKEKIEKIHKKISQSIDYAQRIQNSILPDGKFLKNFFSEYFIFFKPKDVVSGDFYWMTHIDNHTIITVADCTGHGVPGAFMSMLGISFLREIVLKENLTDTGVILNKLREEIIRTLKQKGGADEQRDGMDMSIISINHKTSTIQFSGANNPIYIVKNGNLNALSNKNKKVREFKLNEHSPLKLYEIRPDKMPIAIYVKMNSFTTYEFTFEKDELIYMFSDGFIDQFGGPKLEKFMQKRFKRLLLENSKQSMTLQKEILNTAFEEWKTNTEQTDDVLILGIKI